LRNGYHYLRAFLVDCAWYRDCCATTDMQFNIRFGLAATAALAVVSGCGEHRAGSPLSPSTVSGRAADNARPARAELAPRLIDADGDGYEDPAPPVEPGTGPLPDPNQPPTPTPPPIDGVPVPVQLTITVVAPFGASAFVPNPLHASIGNTIVWVNNDLLPHNIVLDDGTPVGNLLPGQSSAPITLLTETAGYHCTFHPSMVGQVMPVPVSAEPLPPGDPSQPPPTAPPTTEPPPPTYDYGGEDGYSEYDYY
jgi:hypothetical protein